MATKLTRNPQDMDAPEVVRFFSYVSKDSKRGCWLWTGAKGSGYDTYGRFNIRGRVHRSHRLAYRLLVGDVPNGYELRHVCDVPACVNPAHLVPSTHAENMADMKAKGRGGSRTRGVTHCPKGHPYSGSNLYEHKGHRQCRECKRAHWRMNYGKQANATR